MRIKVENPYGSTSLEQIALFEARWKVVLPDEYKRFLLKSNGGRPSPDVFDVPGYQFEGGVIDSFYGLHSGEYYQLERAYEVYLDRIPTDMVPMALDNFGNVVCIGWKGERRGKIYFWDHEDELDENGLSRQDYSNVFLVANSLEEFLGKLKELED
ncbi:MAG: SMI1/KNR4 family protein [Polyangiaceae bacterium]|nr:SMI1/KNR4 family protein [Polyangiaceae bacterium]